MGFFRGVFFFFSVLIVFEAVAISAVAWSFYESIRNSLRQESLLSDHRARDLVLALAKASELRLNKNGLPELDKTFQRYQSQTGKDPEHFVINEIVLLNPLAVVLAHSHENQVESPLEKRKPHPDYENQQYFKVALRMRKWEWSEPILTPDLKKPFLPKMPDWASQILNYIPEAQANQVKMAAPVYQEGKLDVIGVVFLKYSRGNLVLLFENQWKLCQWMAVNYGIIALGASIFLTAIWSVFGSFKRKGVIKEVFDRPELIEKRLYSPIPSAILEESPAFENIELKENETTDEVTKTTRSQVIPAPNSSRVMDAIYLG